MQNRNREFFFFFNISKSKTYSNIVNEILGTLFNIIELTNHSISTENSWYFLLQVKFINDDIVKGNDGGIYRKRSRGCVELDSSEQNV